MQWTLSLTVTYFCAHETMFSGGSLSCEPLSPAERKEEYNNLSGHFFCLTTLNLETFLQAASANVTGKYDSKLCDWDINQGWSNNVGYCYYFKTQTYQIS